MASILSRPQCVKTTDRSQVICLAIHAWLLTNAILFVALMIFFRLIISQCHIFPPILISFHHKRVLCNSPRPSLPLQQKWRYLKIHFPLKCHGIVYCQRPLAYSLAMSAVRTTSLCFQSRPSRLSLQIFPRNTWLASWKALPFIRLTWRLCGGEVKYRFNPEWILFIELQEYSLPTVPRAHA